MATQLSDINPAELSLVRRGAVRRPFLFAKEDGDQVEATPALLWAFAKEHGMTLEQIAKEAEEVAPVEEPAPGDEPAAAIEKNDDEGVDMPESPGAVAVPIQKEDGSWDLSGVADEQRASFEAILKAHDDEVAELRKAAEAEKATASEALEIAKAEKDARETREWIAKAETIEHLGVKPDELGGILHSLAKAEDGKHVPDGTVEKLEAILKAADETARAGGIFKEAGRSGAAPGSATAELDAKADEIRKSDSSLSKEQALAKAYEQYPDLYAKQREEA